VSDASKVTATRVICAPRTPWQSTKLQAIQSNAMEKRYCVACCQIRNGNKPHKRSAPVGFSFKACFSLSTQTFGCNLSNDWFISLPFSLDEWVCFPSHYACSQYLYTCLRDHLLSTAEDF
jgi:hypothetical protein